MKIRSKSIFSALTLLLVIPLHAGSLWKEGVTDERGMFADKRAKRVGDVITIVVQEIATFTNSLRLKTDKESKAGAAGLASNLLNTFLQQLPSKLLTGKSALLDKTSKMPFASSLQGATNNIVIPDTLSLPVTGQNDYNGGGEINNKQSISARVAVQVIDVLPNGNLVVEGVRSVSFSKERQYASLRGIIRPYDVQPDNTVLSGNIADAQIEIVSEGTLTDAQKKGWLLKINDKINPF